MTILLIEDGQKIINSLASGLASERHIPDVRDFQRASHEILNMNLGVYTLVIMDCKSFSPDHIELCEKIHRRIKTLPILIVTTSFSKENERAAFAVRASGYMWRPISIEALETKIKTLTHRLAQTVDKIFIVGELKLDSINKKVSVKARVIQITNKEFSILELLMRNFGEVVSRKKISEIVWRKERGIVSNIIDVHIKNLRKKLKFRNVPTIETSRASGYRLMEK